MSDIAEIKSLIDKQARLWEEHNATNDELIKAKADGKAVAEIEAKLVKNGAKYPVEKAKGRSDKYTEL